MRLEKKKKASRNNADKNADKNRKMETAQQTNHILKLPNRNFKITLTNISKNVYYHHIYLTVIEHLVSQIRKQKVYI